MTQAAAYRLAETFRGLKEIAGPRDEAKIVQMFAAVGHAWVKDDETAWCAAFVGAMIERVGLISTKALNARSYLDWGEEVDPQYAQAGDVVVFSRGDPKGWQGHVAFFVSQDATNISVLGGNQSNMVSVARYPKSRLLGVRRITPPAPAPKPVSPFLAWLIRFLGGRSNV
tara:strand:+ start:8992 stop:9501 length:510 start_codon:yes stop_codon:yes gene_type:complete